MKMPDASVIQASSLFHSLSVTHPDVEVWPDEEYDEVDWIYFWIVSRREKSVHNLAYVRWKAGHFQKRTYDESGEAVWVNTE